MLIQIHNEKTIGIKHDSTLYLKFFCHEVTSGHILLVMHFQSHFSTENVDVVQRYL